MENSTKVAKRRDLRPTSDSETGISIQLWLKTDVFAFGALQVPPHNRIVFDNLKKLVNYVYIKNQQDFPKLTFPLWRHVACDKLCMAPELAWIYFETYDMLRDLAVPQLGKVFDEASSKRPGNEGPKADVWVDVRRFALLLAIQRIHKISLRSSMTMGDEWPPSSPGSQPPSPRTSQSSLNSTPRSLSVPDSDVCLNFFLNQLNHLIDLLLLPSVPSPSNSSTSNSSPPRNSRAGLSLEAVEALGFLVGAKLVDKRHRSASEKLVNLHEVATIPSLHLTTGYDPHSKTFDYRVFEEFLRSSIVPDPFAFPSITTTGYHLPWLGVPDFKLNLRASTSPRNTILSNLNLAPRPREKITYISNLAKETIARSDDDDHLYLSSVKLHRCRDSAIYFLAPMRAALITKCKNMVVVLGCVETTLHISGCENIRVIVCCRRISIAASKRCQLHVMTPSTPMILGHNEDITLAPYHTVYPDLHRHLDLCNIGTKVNRWNEPYAMGGSVESGNKPWRILPPEDLNPFIIPFEKPRRDKDNVSQGNRTDIPGGLPKEYQEALMKKGNKISELNWVLQTECKGSKSEELNNIVIARFQDWISSEPYLSSELNLLSKNEAVANISVEDVNC